MRELLLRTRRLVGTLAVPAVAATAVVGVWGAAPAGAVAPCLTTDFGGVRLIDWDGYNPKVEFSSPMAVSIAVASFFAAFMRCLGIEARPAWARRAAICRRTDRRVAPAARCPAARRCGHAG